MSPAAPTTAGSVAGGSLSPSVPEPTPSPQLKGKQLEELEEHGEEKRQCSRSMQEEECEGLDVCYKQRVFPYSCRVHIVVPSQLNKKHIGYALTLSFSPLFLL